MQENAKDSLNIQRRESDFHDRWAESTRSAGIPVRQAFEAPTALENRFIRKLLGDLSGKRMLDVGCGLGESSVYFALLGADVTAVDLSPGMVDRAMDLGRLHRVNIKGVVQAGESLNVPEGYYDIVYTANTIHHVTDKDSFFRGVHQALKPGGRFVSFDPLVYNPAIEVYRRMATAVRTEDEAPLSFRDAKLAGKYFRNVHHREFWILTLSLFFKYYFIDRVHPNSDRYWKRILRETPESLWWWMPLERIDRVLARLPLVRRLAWNMVMWGEKAGPDGEDG